MPTMFKPEIGDWYKNERDMSFEVTAVDEEDGIVEIQYFDGALEELDLSTWYEMDLVPRRPPEQWTGPFDPMEPPEPDEAEWILRPHAWTGPLDAVE